MGVEGEQVKLKSGLYRLNSIRPGQYLNGDQYRPAHIHAKVWVDGAVVLTTQLYFADDPYNFTLLMIHIMKMTPGSLTSYSWNPSKCWLRS